MLIDDDVFFEMVVKKLDKVESEIGEIKVILARNTKDVEIHIRRSDLLDESMHMLREQIAPAKKMVDYLKTSFQLLGVISIIVGIFVGITKLLI